MDLCVYDRPHRAPLCPVSVDQELGLHQPLSSLESSCGTSAPRTVRSEHLLIVSPLSVVVRADQGIYTLRALLAHTGVAIGSFHWESRLTGHGVWS